MDDAFFQNRKRKPGLYLLFVKDGSTVYVGKTVELDTRIQGHIRKKKPDRLIFAFPSPHESDLEDGELELAESLALSYFDEICPNINDTLGRDTLPPSMAPLRRVSAFVTAFVAAVFLLGQNNPAYRLPFRRGLMGDVFDEDLGRDFYG